MRDAVGGADAVGGLFELRRERGEAGRGPGRGELEQLRQLDDGRARDDAVAEALVNVYLFIYFLKMIQEQR